MQLYENKVFFFISALAFRAKASMYVLTMTTQPLENKAQNIMRTLSLGIEYADHGTMRSRVLA